MYNVTQLARIAKECGRAIRHSGFGAHVRVSRHMSTQHAMKASRLHIGYKGEPLDVLTEVSDILPAPERDQVTIQLLAAPINPSDVNTVQVRLRPAATMTGKYPLFPESHVGGHEGVGRVTALGPHAKKLQVGQMVVPLSPGLGTWRTAGNFNEMDWHAISEIPVADAATLSINPGTALSMLRNFVDLKPGDVVLQDGANGTVGEYVIALARFKGLKTANIVRDRPDWDHTVQRLEALGATLVATPEEVREKFKASGLPAPKLALDCVGGDVATTMAKMLAVSGTLVNYGAMGLRPVSVPAPLLIFKDLRVRGFWISGHMSNRLGLAGKAQLMDELVELVQNGVIKADCQLTPFTDWKRAFSYVANRQRRDSKVLLSMQ